MTDSKPVLIVVFFLTLVGLVIRQGPAPRGGAFAQSGERTEAMSEYRGKVNAPDFPKGMQWLNTDRPLSLKDLRGKVVLLDFWTYCCINCMHVLPDLKRLERKYPKELVVIGVHSAKFTAEKDTDNIRQAILRYEIEHPVVNDGDRVLWDAYEADGWPSFYLIDPDGKLAASLSGEDVFEPLDKLISGMIREFDREGKINREPIRFALERERTPRTALSFPGKVLADERSARLFIADSGNNRIVVASLDGEVREVIGVGAAGLTDGQFAEARFNKPQGMTLDGETLYVADTENHVIRGVDLVKRTVRTIAGTGRQARRLSTPGRLSAAAPLSSPWDLVHRDGKLYIAMAGAHQIWVLDLRTRRTGAWAGSGREGRIDGDLAEAALAQPSGITTDGEKLYFADSETSSIRSAEIAWHGKVETIVGLDLFEFGDRDGKGEEVRLQHPLGVVFYEGMLYVADTYNNKIKRIDPKTGAVETLFGGPEAGLVDGGVGAARFDEPGGLSVAGGKIYVADTNNHVIRVVELKTRTVSTLPLPRIDRGEGAAGPGG